VLTTYTGFNVNILQQSSSKRNKKQTSIKKKQVCLWSPKKTPCGPPLVRPWHEATLFNFFFDPAAALVVSSLVIELFENKLNVVQWSGASRQVALHLLLIRSLGKISYFLSV